MVTKVPSFKICFVSRGKFKLLLIQLMEKKTVNSSETTWKCWSAALKSYELCFFLCRHWQRLTSQVEAFQDAPGQRRGTIKSKYYIHSGFIRLDSESFSTWKSSSWLCATLRWLIEIVNHLVEGLIAAFVKKGLFLRWKPADISDSDQRLLCLPMSISPRHKAIINDCK